MSISFVISIGMTLFRAQASPSSDVGWVPEINKVNVASGAELAVKRGGQLPPWTH
jgi:hypothetical protein